MPRALRKFQDGGVYHLISRGNNKRAILEVSQGYHKFRELLLLAQLKFDWRIYHYCFMPNHLHILAYIEQGKQLPLLMQYILQSYSRWHKNKTGYVGYLWQGRYKSLFIEDEIYLLECGRYIERNPVRANLSEKLEDYPWSSYKHYAFGKNDALIYPNPSYQNFGNSVGERQEKYREFVCLKDPVRTGSTKATISKFL